MLVSSSANKSAAVPLGLDNPSYTGAPHRSASNGPYDFNGATGSTARPYDVANLSSGSHTVTAEIAFITAAPKSSPAPSPFREQTWEWPSHPMVLKRVGQRIARFSPTWNSPPNSSATTDGRSLRGFVPNPTKAPQVSGYVIVSRRHAGGSSISPSSSHLPSLIPVRRERGLSIARRTGTGGPHGRLERSPTTYFPRPPRSAHPTEGARPWRTNHPEEVLLT